MSLPHGIEPVPVQLAAAKALKLSVGCIYNTPCFGRYIAWIVTSEKTGYEAACDCQCECHQAAGGEPHGNAVGVSTPSPQSPPASSLEKK